MPRALTEQEREQFLAEPRVAVVSVAAGDRPPLAVPVWYGYEPGGNGEMPYKYVTVEGTVVAADRPPTAEQMLAVAGRYLLEEYAQGFVEGELAHPASELVLFTVRPDRWLTNDFADDMG